MSKKILLASGCSYTDENFKSLDSTLSDESRGSWPMWPELMGKELNLKVVNKGLSGRGVDHILDSIIDQISLYGERIDIVAILLSGCDRWPFFGFSWNPFTDLTSELVFHHDNARGWQALCGVTNTMNDLWNSKGFDSRIYRTMVENQLRKMCAIVDICKANNIKLIMNQGVEYFSFETLDLLMKAGTINEKQYVSRESVASWFVKNPMFAKLDRMDNIIGWPFLDILGGSCFDYRRGSDMSTYVSDRDRHPNAYGQTLIAKEFLKKYGELY